MDLTFLDAIPEDLIAITVYLGGSAIVLWCWYLIAKRLFALGEHLFGERLRKRFNQRFDRLLIKRLIGFF